MIRKEYCILILLFIALAFNEKHQPDPLQVSAGFERGAIGEITWSGPDSVILNARHWKKWDGIGDQYYWFYFALYPVKHKKVTVVLNQLTGIYRGMKHEVFTDFTQPVFSYNKADWQRIPSVQYYPAKKSFSFTQYFEQDTAWVAYAHPYALMNIDNMRRELAGNSQVKITAIGNSAEGRSLNLFSISDHTLPAANKKTAVLIALQHGGEDAGGYLAEGMIRFLSGNDTVARAVRQKWVVHILPVVNPDGLYHGITRYNTHAEDLNSSWFRSEDSVQRAPEVKAICKWMHKQFSAARPPDLFFDVHSHSQQITANNIFSGSPEFGVIAKQATALGFPLRFNNEQAPFKGESSGYVSKYFGMPAAVMELTQSYANNKKYLTIGDYRQYGTLLIKALHHSYDLR